MSQPLLGNYSEMSGNAPDAARPTVQIPQTIPRRATVVSGRVTYEQTPEVTVTDFSADGVSTVYNLADMSALEQLLTAGVATDCSRWVSFIGEVDPLAIEMLETQLNVIPSLLIVPDADMHFGGLGIAVPADQELDSPQQICLSFGAPLVPALVPGMGTGQNEYSTDVARLGFHLVMVGSTLITFSKLDSQHSGVFRSDERADRSSRRIAARTFTKSAFLHESSTEDDTGIRVAVVQKMQKVGKRRQVGRLAALIGPD